MLEITLKGDKHYMPPSICWNVGRETSYNYDTNNAAFDLDDVKEVFADGEELAWIKEYIVNLPYPRNRKQVRWDGELARIIAQAIPGCT